MPRHLRFDFAHFSKMTDEEIAKVEQIVNDKIMENVSLDEKRNVPIEQAKEMGATMPCLVKSMVSLFALSLSMKSLAASYAEAPT
jgi:hypothetical protein